MDYAKLIRECSSGWGPCKSELLSQVGGDVASACSGGNTPECRQRARHEALVRLVDSQGWPQSTVGLAERCLDGSRQDCEKFAALLAAQAACVSITAGSCPPCCGFLVGPLVDLVWPVVGPFIDGTVNIVGSYGSVALERLGLKDEPHIADFANPMMHDAHARSQKFIRDWLEAIGPDGTETVPNVPLEDVVGDVVDEIGGSVVSFVSGPSYGDLLPGNMPGGDKASSTRREPDDYDGFQRTSLADKLKIVPYVDITWTPLECLEASLLEYTGQRQPPASLWFSQLWYPTHYGNVVLPANGAPFAWDSSGISWDYAKDRGDAMQQAANALAELYGARMDTLSRAAAIATGKVAAIRQARIDLAAQEAQEAQGSKSSVWPWLLLLAAAGAGAYAWRQS